MNPNILSKFYLIDISTNLTLVIKVGLALLILTLSTFSMASSVGEKQYKHSGTFAKLVRRLSYNPDDLEAGELLRHHCRNEKIVLECIDALNKLTKKHPKNKPLRYHAALAYVDEVPGHSLFRQGWLSTRSMNHVTSIIDREPEDWLAYYIRGLNGLYWPKSFRKLPQSIKDLEKCISLSSKLPEGLIKPYYGYAYIALGDAFIKNGEVNKGIDIYKLGVSKFNSKELDKRLSMDNESLKSFISELRHTDTRVNTTLSFLVDGGESLL